MEDNELRRRLNNIQNGLLVLGAIMGVVVAILLGGVPEWLAMLIG